MGGERGCPEPVLWSLGALKCPSINRITLLSPHNTAITIPNSQMGKLRHGEAQRLSQVTESGSDRAGIKCKQTGSRAHSLNYGAGDFFSA